MDEGPQKVCRQYQLTIGLIIQDYEVSSLDQGKLFRALTVPMLDPSSRNYDRFYHRE